jgi:uncharacterized phiE125 gp8 family phage protein
MLTLVDPPATVPISVAEAKQFARLIGAEYDVEIAANIAAATQTVEQYLGRALITQSWEYKVDCFPYPQGIRIPLAPVQSVAEVSYLDPDGDEVVLSTDRYVFSGGADAPTISVAPGQCWPATLHQREAITISFTAGYGDSWNAVPEPIRMGIALMVSALFDRSGNTDHEQLLDPYRVRAV